MFLSVKRALPASILNKTSLAIMIAMREVRSRYLGSLAGIFWALLQPLLYAVAFVVIRSLVTVKGLAYPDAINPALYAFVGVAVFQVWYESMCAQVEYLRRSAVFLKIIVMPPDTFFLAGLFVSIFDGLIRALLILVALIIFQVDFLFSMVLFPVVIVFIVLTGNVIGYFLSIFGTFYKDVSKFLSAITLGVMLGSPVLYPATENIGTTVYYFQLFNPLASGLEVLRYVLFGIETSFIPSFLFSLFILTVLAFFVSILSRKITPFALERL